MEGSPNTLDRAQWRRFTPRGGRCIVCGHSADVTINLTAIEVTGTKAAPALSKDVAQFCNVHGLERYGAALRTLQTGTSAGKGN